MNNFYIFIKINIDLGEDEDIFTTISSLVSEVTLAQLMETNSQPPRETDRIVSAPEISNVDQSGTEMLDTDQPTTEPPDMDQSGTALPEDDQTGTESPDSDQSGSEMPDLGQSGDMWLDAAMKESLVAEKVEDYTEAGEALPEAASIRPPSRNR
jgi:hypothetical protein